MAAKTAILTQLWQGALAGSVPASQKWVLTAMQRYGSGLVTMLWRILGDEHDVCDAYQDTFLHLANAFADRRKPAHIRAYLYRTASNNAITMLRRRQLSRKYQQTIAQSTDESITVDYARQLDTEALQKRLRNAISKLPDYLADVVVLRDLAEMPYEQVASILNISKTAARVYRHKAIQMLAVLLNKEKSAGER